MELKNKIVQACLAEIEKRIDTARSAMESAEESAKNETKSSAGDKFETGRAMMHLEKEKNKVQLIRAIELKNLLKTIDLSSSDMIREGSLVKTSNGHFFISVGLGKFSIEDNKIFTLSKSAPLFQKMRGLKKGDHFEMNEKQIEILEVF